MAGNKLGFVMEREGVEVVEGEGEESRGREEGGETTVVVVAERGNGGGQI